MSFVLQFVENYRKFGHIDYDLYSNSAAKDKKMIKT